MQRGYRSSRFLSGGNLNNGSNAGSAYLNLNNGLGNADWNIGGRNCDKRILPTECRGRNNPPAATSGCLAERRK